MARDAVCEGCGRGFPGPEALAWHLRHGHEGAEPATRPPARGPGGDAGDR